MFLQCINLVSKWQAMEGLTSSPYETLYIKQAQGEIYKLYPDKTFCRVYWL